MGWIERKIDKRKLKGCPWFTCLMLCAFSFQLAQAQTFAEWFSQKKTQIKYLTQQIAALEQYQAYLKQGYMVSKNGLGFIGGAVKAEFDLHGSYYSSLKVVNPFIGHSPKVDSILRIAQGIPGQFDQLDHLALTTGTRDYIGSVSTSVLKGVDQDLSELQMILSNQVTMTDDERWRRLDVIDTKLREKLVFTRSFCNQVRVLVDQRSLELQDIQTQKSVYENN
jgi:hypothetical protein